MIAELLVEYLARCTIVVIVVGGIAVSALGVCAYQAGRSSGIESQRVEQKKLRLSNHRQESDEAFSREVDAALSGEIP